MDRENSCWIIGWKKRLSLLETIRVHNYCLRRIVQAVEAPISTFLTIFLTSSTKQIHILRRFRAIRKIDSKRGNFVEALVERYDFMRLWHNQYHDLIDDESFIKKNLFFKYVYNFIVLFDIFKYFILLLTLTLHNHMWWRIATYRYIEILTRINSTQPPTISTQSQLRDFFFFFTRNPSNWT